MSDQPLVHQLSRPHRLSRLLIFILVSFFLLSGTLFALIFFPSRKLLFQARLLRQTGDAALSAAKAQDLPEVDRLLGTLSSQLENFHSQYRTLSWLRFVPLANAYYTDGQRLLTASGELVSASQLAVKALTPYADVIGLKGLATTGDGAKTAQDRINFIINTLDKVRPQLSQIGIHLATAKSQIEKIDLRRYPDHIRTQPIRPLLEQRVNLLSQADALVNQAQPLLSSAPYLLGLDAPRKYLVLFHNDAELRPTGGFLTAYAAVSVDKGQISIIQSDDMYNLDSKLKKKSPAPEVIKTHLKQPVWHIRDQNLSPDFKTSMDTFYDSYTQTGSPEVDGIVSVNTQVLVDLLRITGPIGVSGFGKYTAETDQRCNCPQVFYELEKLADIEGPVVWDTVTGRIIYQPPNYGARKSFIGPMMYSVLANVMAQPKAKMGQMFTTVMTLLQAKHLQFYLLDPQAQAAVESFNLAGRVQKPKDDQDYLLIVDTNLAGAKTNAWVIYAADQKIDISPDGSVVKTLTLTYKNPQAYFEDPETKLRLNGLFRNWLRVYVPEGSKLLESAGFEHSQKTSTDLGLTVFEGFFTLAPQNVAVITFKYELPFKVKSPYQLLLQKQAGSKNFAHHITINGQKHPEILLSADKELSLTF